MRRLFYQAGLLTGLIIFVPTVVVAASIMMLITGLSRFSGSFGVGLKQALEYTNDLFAEKEEWILKYGED